MTLALVSLVAAALAQLGQEPALVELERRGGLELWTVRARDCAPRLLLERVARLSGRTLESTTALEGAPLVSIELERRPLEQVLEFALGSAGLLVDLDEHGVRVRADLALEDTPDARAGLAAAAWTRATARHPRHANAPGARLALGELEELRGRVDVARSRYLDVLAGAPSAPATGEAYLRAGRIAAERGDWNEASEHFRALANLAGAESYRHLARTELARATLGLGDAPGALHILDALDESLPAWEATDRTARALVRLEALLALGRASDALLWLDANAGALDPLGASRVPALRARALESAGLLDEASRAWLAVAECAVEPERSAAYRSAARLADAAGDPLGVLFVARQARAAGAAPAIAEAEERARTSLGLDTASAAVAPDAPERLAQAERWLESGADERAADELAELFAARAGLALSPAERARLAVAWIACVARAEGFEAAAGVARAERPLLADATARATLDAGVARMLERHGEFERAADAYRGDY